MKAVLVRGGSDEDCLRGPEKPYHTKAQCCAGSKALLKKTPWAGAIANGDQKALSAALKSGKVHIKKRQ
jgi:hypothetical protein